MPEDKITQENINVLINVDGAVRAEFFLRLAKMFRTLEAVQIAFITDSMAAARLIKRSGYQVTALRGRAAAPNEKVTALYENSLCGALGTLSRRAAAGMYKEIHDYLRKQPADVIWCWNGAKFVDRVLRDSGVPLKAFEVANVPGYFVIEDGGVNAESASYRRLVIENMPQPAPKDFDFEAWRADYIAKKDQQRSIPQAKVAASELFDKLYIFLSVGKTTPKFLLFQIDRILGYVAKAWINKFLIALAASRLKRKHVVFFPQQVSSDTQIIFNSDYDNESALDLLLREVDANTCVVSNLHPAEHRLSKMLAFLIRCRREQQLIPATGGAWAIIKAADEVVTINSTVGLEAAIYGCPCRFLGRSLFVRLVKDPEALKWFLGEHIIPIATLHSAEPLTPNLIERLLHDAPA